MVRFGGVRGITARAVLGMLSVLGSLAVLGWWAPLAWGAPLAWAAGEPGWPVGTGKAVGAGGGGGTGAAGGTGGAAGADEGGRAGAAGGVAALGERYVWRNVVVGGGGFAPNILFSRRERGLAYLRTDMGGVYRWSGREGRWIALQDGMPESSYFGIESVALDPVDPGVVYVAAGMYHRDGAAILRSRDRGDHWEVFPTSFRMGGNEDGRGVGERLAVDPHERAVLYFGSRFDGLQRSTDRGRTWSRVESFPVRGLGLPADNRQTHAGISFVVFDEAPDSRAVWVGVADPGPQHLFRSDDGGASWHAVGGEPRADLLPVRAELDGRGILYIAYSNGVGPNGVTDGAVYRYDTHAHVWADITPEKGPSRAPGGYMGLSIDRQKPDTLIVASLNRWRPGDILWRSIDGGRTWVNLRERSRRDVADSPFLLWGEREAAFGWWMAGVAIDPFDSDFAAYTTGATVYATHALHTTDTMLWKPWVNGIEQTAVITLSSPPQGPALLSGFGDISGFAHEDLGVSLTEQFTNPVFSNTNTIDYAGLAPQVVVRSGTPAPHAHSPDEGSSAPTLAFSVDSGRTWQPLAVPATARSNGQITNAAKSGAYLTNAANQRGAGYVDQAMTTSADGTTFVVAGVAPVMTRDRGKTWSRVTGLPVGTRAVADRAQGQTFYGLDFERATVVVSRDGGATFSDMHTTGLPADFLVDRPTWREAPWPLVATPGREGDLWVVSRAGLFHSRDGGQSFTRAGARNGDRMGDQVGAGEREGVDERGDAGDRKGVDERGGAGDRKGVDERGGARDRVGSGERARAAGSRAHGSERGEVLVTALSFGRAAPGRDYPALYALGVREDVFAIWRSDDAGASWIRVNDAGHEYGRRFRCISGDPRVFGRVYVGTDGRGILYGEPQAGDMQETRTWE